MSTPPTSLLIAAMLLGTAGCLPMAWADTGTPPALDEATPQGWAFVFENDLLGTDTAQDRWYTNGLQIATVFKAGQAPDALKPTLAWGAWMVPTPCEGAGCQLSLSTALGQNIYTPRHLDDSSFQRQDRPWAGWLYGGLALSNLQGQRHQSVALKAGPIGPASLAQSTQDFAHCCLSDSAKPMGWQHQLRPRLGVQLSYLSTHALQAGRSLGWQASWGGAAGNVHTMLTGGLAVSWSWTPVASARPQAGTLDEGEFFTPDIGALASDGGLMDSLRHTVFYAHVQASAVAYNVFLEGRTYSGHTDIKPRRAVGTSTVGFALPLGSQGRHRLNLAWKRRTPEFKVPGGSGRDLYQSWGVISYAFDFGDGR